jgi:hypothetical protein
MDIDVSLPDLDFDGDWQGTWARRNSTANLPIASRLHRNYWMPSLHYMAADGKVVGAYFWQCIYDENADGYLQIAWPVQNVPKTESPWYQTMGDDILVFQPFALWSDRPLERIAPQHYTFGSGVGEETVELYKHSDDFLVNSRWQINLAGYVPPGNYNACASLRWTYDEDTVRLSLYSFNVLIPFISSAGESGEISMIFNFENADVLEERTYQVINSHTPSGQPGLSHDYFIVKYGPGVTQVQRVEDVQLTVTNIGEDVVDITVSGHFLDGTAFLASGSVYITPDDWFPQ